ncbi:hypothetical protein ACFQ15_00570 [Sphingomonas hankookensis]|uniref:hypothetical protein n=1 Tax=Sphingomonas hankookensis TaxID=563996 RepID=UPI001F5A7F55|nr:hypothetical protein [Sphingomonas hankookensis]
MNHRAIEIDFDVHKRIEAERSSFAESANDVLRRLLGIGATSALVQDPAPAAAAQADDFGRAWNGKGVTLPGGTQLRMDYRGQVVTGVVRDGKWLIEGREFSSPSGAAGEMCRTKSGTKTSLDGWRYWEAKRPGDDSWTAISTMRPEHGRIMADIVNIDL